MGLDELLAGVRMLSYEQHLSDSEFQKLELMEFPNLVDEPASPDETLLEWHVFAGLELKVNNYAAVRSTATGGPFRAITVRDAIGDLPNIGNGACETTMEYPREASSWYQRKFRGDMSILTDHISKKMNELNLIRWQIAKLTPPWLLNLAKRRNQWKDTLKVGLGRTFFQPLLQILNQWVWLECVFTQIRTGYFLFGNVLKLKSRSGHPLLYSFSIVADENAASTWVIGNMYDSVLSTWSIIELHKGDIPTKDSHQPLVDYLVFNLNVRSGIEKGWGLRTASPEEFFPE
ncbi:DNA (cytosine-5)-methyltransferase 1B [Vitis vinifera]|uniref:DNA (Cytosine-5)-methyltransferase 1B n=1 Tax=Vitis vinifera TaxID=29760 RepID=A0A438E9I7_VITVI|nr:DNA (cytosine-5)-methyltransferase 1B [Vitis vinifera]